MAQRSFFVFQPAQSHQRFQSVPAKLLTQQDLWNEARQSSGAQLIFRVRSSGSYGQGMQEGDRFESCVGMVDEAVRWRVAFGAVRAAIGIIQHPELKQVCVAAGQLISGQHPATVPAAARQAILENIQKLVMDTPQGIKKPSPLDATLAFAVAAVAQCESGIEAAQYVPFVQALNPFEEGSEEAADRLASIEVVSSATLLAEGVARLCERAPAWLFIEMPAFSLTSDDDAPGALRPPRDDE